MGEGEGRPGAPPPRPKEEGGDALARALGAPGSKTLQQALPDELLRRDRDVPTRELHDEVQPQGLRGDSLVPEDAGGAPPPARLYRPRPTAGLLRALRDAIRDHRDAEVRPQHSGG